MSVDSCRLINLPKITDSRGNLSFLEAGRPIPFIIRRVCWIFDVPGGESYGGNAYVETQEFVIALSGSFDVSVDDGVNQRTISLNRSYFGLFIPRMIWSRMENFSTNSVCLIVSSSPFRARDSFQTYETFISSLMDDSDDKHP